MVKNNSNKYKMSFWNYQNLGSLESKKAVHEWKSMGFNCPITFSYDIKKNKKEDMIELLDECKKLDLKVFLDDKRVYFWNYIQDGEQEYRKNVKCAVDDFASHPAVIGFIIGDEPSREQMETVIPNVYNILYEYAPNLHNYLNLLPYWGNDNNEFTDCFKIACPEEYVVLLDKMVKASKQKSISYDYYGQCCYFDTEKYKDICFHNLRMFSKVAQENNIELFSCPLSVGHLSTRVPNEDDIRWQISIMAAHGVTGFFWFFLYHGEYSSDFRNAPFNEYGEKTETYTYLSRQIRTFMDNHAKILSNYSFSWAKHLNKCYGGFEEFLGDTELISVTSEINKTPLIISKFINDDGDSLYAITNNCQTEPTYVKIVWGGKWGDGKTSWWIAPGQMRIISKKHCL